MYRQVVPLSGTVETNYEINAALVGLFYNDQFSISIERQSDDEAGEQGWTVIRGSVGDQHGVLLEFSGASAAEVATLSRTVNMGTNTLELEITNGLQSAITTALARGDTLRMIITPAIAPVIDGQNEFPANNISVESLNSAFRKRDLQDIYAREFALRGPKGEPGRRGWVPQLTAETFVPAEGSDAQILIKLEAWIGGEGERPTEFVGQYLDRAGGWTSDRSLATNFRGIQGPQGIRGQGPRGQTGYNPEFRVINDGARRVLQLSNWGLPQGESPSGTLPVGVGQYLGPNGLTPTIADATDFRGAAGADGTDGDDGDDGTDGAAGRRGPQGRYAVRVYIALTEAERTVNGVIRNPNRPTATGYDPTNNTLQGLTSNPAWSLNFPSGDDITDDDKDVFESFATYDPATEMLSSFTTPFKVDFERGPSGAAGADGTNGWSPNIGLEEQGVQTRNRPPIDQIFSTNGAFTDETVIMSTPMHLHYFYRNSVSGNDNIPDGSYIMPSAIGATAVAGTSSLTGPAALLVRLGAVNLSDAYNDDKIHQISIARNNAYITAFLIVKSDDMSLLVDWEDITGVGESATDTRRTEFELVIDGVSYGRKRAVRTSQAQTIYSQIERNSSGHDAEFLWEGAGNIMLDEQFHQVELRVNSVGNSNDSGTYNIRHLGKANSSPANIENAGSVIRIDDYEGGTGVAPYVPPTGLYLTHTGVTPYIENATAIAGPKGDTGEPGAQGHDGQFHYSIYINSSTVPANPGTVALTLADIDEQNTHTIGSAIWSNVPPARTAGQTTYVAEAIIDPSTATSGVVMAVFSSPNALTGDKGEKGDQGAKGDTGLPGASNPTASGRNFVINGGMVVDQRENSTSALFQAASEGTISRKWVKDRWSLANQWTDYGITISTEKTNATRSRRALKLTTATGTGTVTGRSAWAHSTSSNIALPTTGAITLSTTLNQEAALKAGWGLTGAADLQLSFMFKSPTANTNYTIQLIDHAAGTNTNKLVSFRATARDTWERHTITIGARTSGDAIDVDNVNNKGLEIQFRVFETAQYTEATGTTATSWTGTAADLGTLNGGEGARERLFATDDESNSGRAAWEISDVQLEKNTGATEFEVEEYDRQLERCRKYYNEVKFNPPFDSASASVFQVAVRSGTTKTHRALGQKALRLDNPRLSINGVTLAPRPGAPGWYLIPRTNTAVVASNNWGSLLHRFDIKAEAGYDAGWIDYHVGVGGTGTLQLSFASNSRIGLDAEFEA